jgi:soluble cytochrome b562
MNFRFASVLLALALPLTAQDTSPSAAEAVFYKAFYLEKGQLDYAGAMVLYEQFLVQAPDHTLAAQAAKQQYLLLDKTGKVKERDAFKAKYGKLIGDISVAADGAARPDGQPRRGDDQGQGRGAGRPDPAARIAELEKQLAAAKEAGDDERVKELEQQIARAKQMGERGRGAGMLGDKKLAEMSAEELKQFRSGLDRMETMIDRMRERAGDEQADKMQAQLDTLRKHLDANQLDEAQKALDAIRDAMPRRQRVGDGPAPGGRGTGGR